MRLLEQLNMWKWYSVLWAKEYRKLARRSGYNDDEIQKIEGGLIKRSLDLGLSTSPQFLDLSYLERTEYER